MTTEVASVIIIFVACGTIIYFVTRYMKTINDEYDDILYRYYFTFLVEYSTPTAGVRNVFINVPIIERTYSKALEKTITPLLQTISAQILKNGYVLNRGWFLDVNYEIVK